MGRVLKTADYKRIYNSIIKAVEDDFDNESELESAASVIFMRLLTGDLETKDDIIDTYELESCNVCEQCGELMCEGWMLGDTHVCSDECAAKFFDIPVEQFQYLTSKPGIIQQYLKDAGEKNKFYGKSYYDLTEEEKDEIYESHLETTDCYWTGWEA
jgi:hypothetical protein